MLLIDNIKRISTIMVILLAILMIGGCSREGENIPTAFPTITSLRSDGWRYFENAQYDLAIENFNEARNRDAASVDAYNGLGWTHSREANYTDAESNFKLLLALTDDPALQADAYAGLAMMYFATPKDLAGQEKVAARNARDSIAVNFILKVFEINSNYSFSHDARINATAFYKVIAQSYFNRQLFLTCINEIETNLVDNYFQTLINKGLVVFVENDTTAALRIDSPVTGIGYLTIINQATGNERELVEVVKLKDLSGIVEYEIISFSEGGGNVVFQGNPIPKIKDLFLVDYYVAPDYGQLLADILQEIQVQ